MTKVQLIDLWAYTSIVMILGTYLALARGWFGAVWFHAANAYGAVSTGWSAYLHRAFPSLVITVAFGVIGVVGLWSYATRPRSME